MTIMTTLKMIIVKIMMNYLEHNDIFTSEAFAAIKVEAAVKHEGNTER